MPAIDYAGFALVLRRCAEIARDGTGRQVEFAYSSVLASAADEFLAANDAATRAERAFERENKAIVEALSAMGPAYLAALTVVRAHFPSAVLPQDLTQISSVFDRALAVEAVLNILDDAIMEDKWAVNEMMGPFGAAAPPLLRELGEAALALPALGPAMDARGRAYAPAFERHRVFKRVVRRVLGPQSGEYQSIHWRAAWGHEGAGPVSWGPFSFRAPFKTW